MGIIKEQNVLLSVLKQSFITSDAQVGLKDITRFLTCNGFENFRQDDYKHKQLGLILEDMHEENVIVNSEHYFSLIV